MRNWSKWAVLLAVLCVVTIVAGCAGKSSQLSAQAPLVIQVLDIGQGDAILIRTTEQVILVDSGDVPAREQLVTQLKKQGVSVIDKVIITHPHADHMGGMAAVLEQFIVRQIYDSGQTTTTALYRKYLETVKRKNIPFSLVKAGDTLDFGGGVVFRVFSPAQPFITESALNNNSIVGKVVYGDFSMLLTGDAEQQAEEQILKKYGKELKSSVLKSGHHGSNTSSTVPFLREVSPEAAIISVGVNNDYHHPHPGTLKKFEQLKIKVYRTDLDGTVSISSDGNGYTITKEQK